jgi:hypothetical protein
MKFIVVSIADEMPSPRKPAFKLPPLKGVADNFSTRCPVTLGVRRTLREGKPAAGFFHCLVRKPWRSTLHVLPARAWVARVRPFLSRGCSRGHLQTNERCTTRREKLRLRRPPVEPARRGRLQFSWPTRKKRPGPSLLLLSANVDRQGARRTLPPWHALDNGSSRNLP